MVSDGSGILGDKHLQCMCKGGYGSFCNQRETSCIHLGLPEPEYGHFWVQGCLEEQGLKPPEVVFWQFGGLGGSCLVTWALSRCQIPRPASFVHNQRFLVFLVETVPKV